MSTKVAMATGPFQDGVGCGNWARAVASWPGQATVRTVAGCSPGWAGLTARGRSWRDGVGALDILGVHDAGADPRWRAERTRVPPRLVNVRLPGPVPVCAWAGCGLGSRVPRLRSGRTARCSRRRYSGG